MCDLQQNPASTGDHPDRRAFLKRATIATVPGLVGTNLRGKVAYADALTREQRDKMTPDEIIGLMRQGNERFRAGRREDRNFLREQQASAKGQYPAAVVLSCIDSRAPAEVIMDLGIGDIFNARLAGNIANQDILGSMEFGCQVAGAKVVLVMGHTACGAIKGAIDQVQLGNLTNLLAKIHPAVEATQYNGERSSKNNAFVGAVARKNVELTMTNIRQQSSILQNLESKGALKIVGSMYDLDTALIEFLGLTNPPFMMNNVVRSLVETELKSPADASLEGNPLLDRRSAASLWRRASGTLSGPATPRAASASIRSQVMRTRRGATRLAAPKPWPRSHCGWTIAIQRLGAQHSGQRHAQRYKGPESYSQGR